MKTSNRTTADSAPSAVHEKRKQFRLLYFADDEVDERESVSPVYPHAVRATDGGLRIVQHQREDLIMATVKVADQSYRLRQFDRHVLFRSLYSPPAGDMLFLPDTTTADFAETCALRGPGRCILHATDHVYYDYYLYYYLFFDLDGTGFALHSNTGYDQKRAMRVLDWERVDFRWDDFPGMEVVLTAPVEDLRDVCESLFQERINRLLRMPVVDYGDLPQVPLTWQSGSETDFRWLTRAICLTEPGLLDAEEPIVAVYRAAHEGRRGGFLRVERGSAYHGDHYVSRRLMTLCDLVFRLNPCTGMEWVDRSSSYREHQQLQRSALRVKVEIDSPTAHEKAEALLSLQEWLDDKLYDPEKRARFSLPPRIVS